MARSKKNDELERKIKDLLENTLKTEEEIAAECGVDIWCVKKHARGLRRYEFYGPSQAIHIKKAVRCPGCGGLVLPPCAKCEADAAKNRGL